MKQKDLWIFGTEKEVRKSNNIIGAGLTMIVIGVATVIIGESRFYKNTKAIKCSDPNSTVINDIFEDIVNHRMSEEG